MEIDPTVVKALEKIVTWAQDMMVQDKNSPTEPKVEASEMETGPGELEDEEPDAMEIDVEAEEPKKSILGRHLLGVGAMNSHPRGKLPVGKKRY